MSKRTNKKLNVIYELEYETMGSIADGTSFFDFSMINSFADLKETIINPFLDEWNQDVNFDEMDLIFYTMNYNTSY
jgi:hypothetical protein